MTNLKRGIVDVSSLIWTSLMNGIDKDWGREYPDPVKPEKLVRINGWMWGYDGAVDFLIGAMNKLGLAPRDLILVKEGMNSKAIRQALHADYKVGRDKHPKAYEEFQKARDAFIKVFTSLGASVVWQDGIEADDVIGYLAERLYGERWIISNDKDLAQCVRGDVHQYRQGQVDENPFGPFAHHLIPYYIATVGDSGDKIPGGKGFGAGSMEKLLIKFGEDGLDMLGQLIRTKQLRRLSEDVAELKELQKLIDDERGVYLSYELGRLRTEQVNTIRRPLQWQVGMVKQRSEIEDARLHRYAGQKKMVSLEKFNESLDFFKRQVVWSPFVAFDIETSTPDESDEWLAGLEKDEGKEPVDVMGSTVTGFSLTFGANTQYTYYVPVRHTEADGVLNIDINEMVQMLDAVPRDKHLIVHNASFELPVCYNEFGDRWKDDEEWHGFLRNVIDTAIGSSYVNENVSKGLKSLSESLLGYKQTSYDEVTTKDFALAEWDGRGRELLRWQPMREEAEGTERNEVPDGPMMVRVQRKMDMLTATEVFDYGADDAICTAALATYQRIIMELEGSWQTYLDVEQLPAYLTSLGFVQGVDFSLQEMLEMEKDDEKVFNEASARLEAFLISIGYDGTVCPVLTELDAAAIKQAYQIITGDELKTLVRTPSKLAKLIQQKADEAEDGVNDEEYPQKARLLGSLIEANDIGGVNELMSRNFQCRPTLDLNSPKQVAALLYDVLGLPVRYVNKVTTLERQNVPGLYDAVAKHNRILLDEEGELNETELKLIRKKAKSDDDAINYALKFDIDAISQEAAAALKDLGSIKSVMTRRQLFYTNYRRLRHWKTGRIHASANQCAAVTRRYSYSNPNLQQLPKKGEAVRFRRCFLPHQKNAVVASIDFSGQELRLAANRSRDPNLVACYVGEHLLDVHSITAAGAMNEKWGRDKVEALFQEFLPNAGRTPEDEYELLVTLRNLPKGHPMKKEADDLRKDAKNVNFLAQFGGGPVKLAFMLTIRVRDSKLFLDARSARFPEVDAEAKRSESRCAELGYSTTLLGTRRHLRDSIMSDDRSVSSRAARQSWNFEIQGSAAEMTKLAMSRLWRSGVFFRLDCRFIGQIHDELVTSVSAEHAEEFLQVKHSCMTAQYADMAIPIVGSISIGANFADQIECGDDFIPGNIRAALNDIFNNKEAVA